MVALREAGVKEEIPYWRIRSETEMGQRAGPRIGTGLRGRERILSCPSGPLSSLSADCCRESCRGQGLNTGALGRESCRLLVIRHKDKYISHIDALLTYCLNASVQKYSTTPPRPRMRAETANRCRRCRRTLPPGCPGTPWLRDSAGQRAPNGQATNRPTRLWWRRCTSYRS